MSLTMPNIRDRCAVDEDSGCWIWRLGTNAYGCPNARDGAGTVTVRRRVWELDHDERMRKRGWFVVSSCRDRLCVSPAHARRLTGTQYMTLMSDSGTINDAGQRAAVTLAVRARPLTKLNAMTAADIRARILAGEDTRQVAADHNISRGHANKVARADSWAPMRGSSVFALGAA